MFSRYGVSCGMRAFFLEVGVSFGMRACFLGTGLGVECALARKVC